MKALMKVAEGYGNLEIREIPKPEIRNDEVLIEIKAVGICGSDLHHYEHGAATGIPAVHQMAIPVVLGHEFTGDIVDIGGEIKGWALGDRIISETHARICGNCDLCRRGDYHLCPERKGFGAAVDGAFTQYIAVPARLLHRLPDQIDYVEGTVLQPAADVVHAVVTITDLRPGSTVAVIGPGPMGLLAAQLSRVLGAAKVIVSGLDADKARMEVSRKMGVDFIINKSREDLVKRVRELTDGTGADVVFETSGTKAGFLDALKIMAKRGQMTVIGVPTKPVEVSLEDLQLSEQRIQTSIMSTWRDYECAIKLVQGGRLDFKQIVTDVLPLTEWEKAFDLALTKQACKVVFTPIG
jgi:L-iditol 2-dehydrogenase